MSTVFRKAVVRSTMETWTVLSGAFLGYISSSVAIAAILHAFGVETELAFDIGTWVGIALGALFVVICRAWDIKKRWTRCFTDHFRISPPVNRKEVLLMQGLVDSELCARARNLRRAYNAENKARRSDALHWMSEYGIDITKADGVEQAKMAMNNTRMEAVCAKREFWGPHGMARIFGFATKPRYGDYADRR